MDCEKLRADIEKLQGEREILSAKFEEMNESGVGATVARKTAKELGATEDAILEGYLEDFIEKNPEMFKISLGKEVTGFLHDFNGVSDIETMIEVEPGKRVLIGGKSATLYEYSKGDDGEWSLGRNIASRQNASFRSALRTGEDEILLGGINGIWRYAKNDEGEWKLEKALYGLSDGMKQPRSTHAEPMEITQMIELEEGKILVGGKYMQIHELTRLPDGKWEMGPGVMFLDREYRDAEVMSMARIDDRRILLRGTWGTVREYIKGDDGKWTLSETIAEEEMTEGYPAPDGMMIDLDGRNFLVRNNAAIYGCAKDKNGKWSVDEILVPLPDELGTRRTKNNHTTLKRRPYEALIRAMVKLEDGKALVGGDSGVLYECNGVPLNLKNLKDRLDAIVAKGET